MEHKRQFKGTSKPRLFFDIKVRPTGGTRSVSLGRILPKRWYYIRAEVVDRERNSITVKFTKLLEMEADAPDTNANTRRKQDA